jgi:hypothetical protein
MFEPVHELVKRQTGVINNCLDCPHHAVLPDAHFDDNIYNPNIVWDSQVRCRLVSRAVTRECDNFSLRRHSQTPPWCPLAANPQGATK